MKCVPFVELLNLDIKILVGVHVNHLILRKPCDKRTETTLEFLRTLKIRTNKAKIQKFPDNWIFLCLNELR